MLSLRHVTKTYSGDIRALADVSLDIAPGMFGLLGPNGAGKSTLMRTIATLQDADAGTLRFGDIDIPADKTALRRVLGYLPQEFGAYPRTSAERLLRHFAALKGIDDGHAGQVVESLLVQTNLWEVRKRSVDKFSGGMKQRFGIAQALLGDPHLIIVDEPTAGLDPGERRRFQNLLAEIGEDRVVILSTHIVDDVADLCTQVAIMGQGRILKQGTPVDLVAAMSGQVWVQLADRDRVASLRQALQVISTRFHAGRVEVRVRANTQPAGFEPAQAELEDVYFSTLLDHGLKENLE